MKRASGSNSGRRQFDTPGTGVNALRLQCQHASIDLKPFASAESAGSGGVRAAMVRTSVGHITQASGASFPDSHSTFRRRSRLRAERETTPDRMSRVLGRIETVAERRFRRGTDASSAQIGKYPTGSTRRDSLRRTRANTIGTFRPNCRPNMRGRTSKVCSA